MKPDVVKRRATLVLPCIALATACTQATTRGTASPSALLAFDFLGCTRDLSPTEAMRSGVERSIAHGKVTFLVRHRDECGLAARAPSFVVQQDVLRLRYERYDTHGIALLCDCEYQARFTFDASMARIGKVQFESEPVQDLPAP